MSFTAAIVVLLGAGMYYYMYYLLPNQPVSTTTIAVSENALVKPIMNDNRITEVL